MSKSKDANLKLYRIHQIDEAIRSGVYPNKVSLSKQLEVSERTIARDLDYLRNFRVSLWFLPLVACLHLSKHKL